MLRNLFFIAAMTLSLPGAAQCPAADFLIKEHGISFSGFQKKIALVAKPSVSAARAEDLVVIALPNRKGSVPDGFIHSALINKEKKQAWIKRIGGFPSVYQWYGPVKLRDADLDGCVTETYR